MKFVTKIWVDKIIIIAFSIRYFGIYLTLITHRTLTKKDYALLAVMITDEFPNLRDKINPQLAANKNKTLLELRIATVRETLSRAMRNRRHRHSLTATQKSAISIKEKLKSSAGISKAVTNKMMKDSLDERSQDRGNHTLLTEWPILKTFDGICFEFRLIKNLKNTDFINKRIKRGLRNFIHF